MPERKRERPAGLESIALPGHRTAGPANSYDQLVNDVREGIERRRFRRGMLFPEAESVQGLYGLSAQEVRRAVNQLRRERRLHLHDEYRDTYFVDGQPENRRPEPNRKGLEEQVAHLAEIVQDLSKRVQTLENQQQKPNE